MEKLGESHTSVKLSIPFGTGLCRTRGSLEQLSDTNHLKYWVTEPRAFGSSTDCNFLEAGEQSDMPVHSVCLLCN